MRRYLAFVAVLVLAAAVIFGCSASDKSTTPAKTSAERQYEALKPTIDTLFLDLRGFLEYGLTFLEEVDTSMGFMPPGLGKPAHDADTIILDYSYTDGWHEMRFMIDVDSLTFDMRVKVQYIDGTGAPQEEPDQGTASLHVIFDFDIASTVHEMNGEMGQHVDLTYTGLQTSTITVDGTGDLDADFTGYDEHGAVDVDMEYDIDVNDVTMSNPELGGSGCVTGGSAAMALLGTFSGHDDDGQPVSGNIDATVTVVFNSNGKANITATIGGSQFSWIEDACSSI